MGLARDGRRGCAEGSDKDPPVDRVTETCYNSGMFEQRGVDVESHRVVANLPHLNANNSYSDSPVNKNYSYSHLSSYPQGLWISLWITIGLDFGRSAPLLRLQNKNKSYSSSVKPQL